MNGEDAGALEHCRSGAPALAHYGLERGAPRCSWLFTGGDMVPRHNAGEMPAPLAQTELTALMNK